jgi:uncharacterized cupin superfamily protein
MAVGATMRQSGQFQFRSRSDTLGVSAFRLVASRCKLLIETNHCNIDLKPSPIEPSWIIEGNPEARSHVLWTSADGSAQTLIWSCTRGKFNWFYDFDETIVILEGSIVLESEGMPPKRYGVDDAIFFREGARAKWHVEDYVRKVAFCRQTNTFGLAFVVRAINKLKFLRGKSAAFFKPV